MISGRHNRGYAFFVPFFSFFQFLFSFPPFSNPYSYSFNSYSHSNLLPTLILILSKTKHITKHKQHKTNLFIIIKFQLKCKSMALSNEGRAMADGRRWAGEAWAKGMRSVSKGYAKREKRVRTVGKTWAERGQSVAWRFNHRDSWPERFAWTDSRERDSWGEMHRWDSSLTLGIWRAFGGHLMGDKRSYYRFIIIH